MNTLHFEKLSQFDRIAEPVSFSIPFAQKTLMDADHLFVLDGNIAIPTQRHVLARWADGSVKWLLVHLQPDLPGNHSKDLSFEVDSSSVQPAPAQTCTLVESPKGLVVDTGPLTFTIPNIGFDPITDVYLNEQFSSISDQNRGSQPFSGFEMRFSGIEYITTGAPTSIQVLESGPLRCTIEIEGELQSIALTASNNASAQPILFCGRITAYAGKSYIHIEHQFIHRGDEQDLHLEEYHLRYRPKAVGKIQTALGQGFYRTAIEQGTPANGNAVHMDLLAETMLYQANEHFIDSFYGDFWTDWRDGNGGLTLSIYQAHQHFPKGLKADSDGIDCALVPAGVEPIRVIQGMGKTHRIQLYFHGADTPIEECSVRSLQFQLPDRPSLQRAWYAVNNPWQETFFPEKIPGRLMTYLNNLHDGRPKALGMMHFGDAPDAGYTDQGRGGGEAVWVNNEYDRPHACALFYALTGQRRVLDSAIVSARHWIDVDFCHRHDDPLIEGGLKIHTAYHGTGRVTPSHEWTEGFLDYYFLTGNQEGLDAAIFVAENIMRHMERPIMKEPGETAVREGGWALRAMIGMWLGTSEQRWRDEAERIVEMFLVWHQQYGALLAPYTSHTMPRVPFMISLTVNSFARYLLIDKEPRVERLIVNVMDDLIEHCIGPDGIFYYKELPSLQRTAPTPHVIEALAYTYRITGNQEYLRIGARQLAALVNRPEGMDGGAKFIDSSGAVITGRGGGRIFADKYTSILLFAAEAAPLGLLDWYEYP
ncbi:MAG: hypothetical protein AAF702_36215 [Chloroflexota bacterium]